MKEERKQNKEDYHQRSTNDTFNFTCSSEDVDDVSTVEVVVLLLSCLPTPPADAAPAVAAEPFFLATNFLLRRGGCCCCCCCCGCCGCCPWTIGVDDDVGDRRRVLSFGVSSAVDGHIMNSLP